MGIAKFNLEFIKKHLPFGARTMLCLGRQTWCLNKKGEFAEDQLKQELGLQIVESLDVSESDKPTFLADLNKPFNGSIPQYDIVFDGGTIEHVFDPLQALDNVAELVKVGGIFISTQLLNLVGHGFWQLSPELLNKWSLSRGFDNCQCEIRRIGPLAKTRKINLKTNKRIEISSIIPLYMNFVSTRKIKNIEAYQYPVQAGPSLTHPLRFWTQEARLWNLAEKT